MAIIYPTDKGLGPYIIHRPTYIKQCLSKHLQNKFNYIQLSDTEAASELEQQSSKLLKLYEKYKDDLPPTHRQYFDRSLSDLEEDWPRVPKFYGTWKVHKNEPSVRPIISCCGSIPEVYSIYIDEYLKEYVQHLLPTYIYIYHQQRPTCTCPIYKILKWSAAWS